MHELVYAYRRTLEVKVSVAVEHDKRKREILDKALDVFVESGYEDTTFQKIAEKCGITRTILYLYFRNKREIFASSIKRFTEKLECEVLVIAGDQSKKETEKLVDIAEMVMQICERESRLLTVILDYLGHLRTSGGDPDERVRRRTIRMRHILAAIIIEGKKSGEFSPLISVKATSELFYAMIEAAIFRIAVLGRKNADGLKTAVVLFATSLAPLQTPPQTQKEKVSARAKKPSR